jgi:hypothetical protein
MPTERLAVPSRPACEERVAEHFEGSGFRFAGSAAEGVDRRADLDVDEAGLFEHLLPARTGQPPGNSAGPQIDVAQCLWWHGSTVGDVGELQGSAGS